MLASVPVQTYGFVFTRKAFCVGAILASTFHRTVGEADALKQVQVPAVGLVCSIAFAEPLYQCFVESCVILGKGEEGGCGHHQGGDVYYVNLHLNAEPVKLQS